MPHPAQAAEVAAGSPEAPADARVAVLLIGADEEVLAALRSPAAEPLELLTAESLDEAWRWLAEREIGVLCLGHSVSGEQALRFLETLAERRPEHRGLHLVLNAGADLTAFADLLADDRTYYLVQRPPAPAEVAALVGKAARYYRDQCAAEPAPTAAGAAAASAGGVELLRQLAFQDDPANAAELVAEEARTAASADRAYCLLYDPIEELLWTRDPATLERREESPAVGLVSFVLRSGLTVHEARIGEDPRYDRDADDPAGDGRERFAAVTIASAERTAGVLAVVRVDGPEFTAAELHRLEQLATQAAPYLAALLPERRPDVGEAVQQAGYQGELFRRSVVERLFRREEAQADPLRISPVWSRISYWVLVAALVAFVAYALIGEIDEYATGLAVVRIAGRSDVTALAAGTVTAVEVEPGEQVAAGRILVRLDDQRELAELERIEREFKLLLINRLRDASDRDAEQALISRRAERELARSRLRERQLRAPVAASVSEVRVRPGQYVLPGQILVTLAGERVEPTLLVMIPGQYRPLLKPGMRMRFEISGYRYAYQHLEVGSVAEEVVGPLEIQRFLGPGISDAVRLDGPVVLAEARLPSPTFEAAGRTYRYYHGMQGMAEVRVRSEKILLVLVPGLKSLLRDGDGG